MSVKCFRAPHVVASAVFTLLALVASGCAGGYRFVYPNPANVHMIPSSIPHASSCDRSLPDATAAIQRWIDSIPNNSTARLAPRSCYHVEYPLTIGAKTAVVFDGNSSTLAAYTDGCDGTRVMGGQFVNCRYPSPVDALGRTQSDWPRHRYHLQLIGNLGVTVLNLRIEGGKDRPGYDPDYAFQHGIWITGTSDGTLLENVTVDHVWGDFVNFSRHIANGTVSYPQHITIEHSHFGLDRTYMGSGRQGISIGDAADLHFQYNVLQYSSRSAVDIEPVSSSNLLQNIYFDHNTFGSHGNNLFANAYYGTADPIINGVYFRYNTLRGTALSIDSVVPNVESINATDPTTFRRHNYQFVGNVSDTINANGTCPGPNDALRFWGIDGIVIANNVVPLGPNRCMALFDAAKVRDSRVTSNIAQNGIRMAARYYESNNFCEANNYIGSPVVADSSGLAPACRP